MSLEQKSKLIAEYVDFLETQLKDAVRENEQLKGSMLDMEQLLEEARG